MKNLYEITRALAINPAGLKEDVEMYASDGDAREKEEIAKALVHALRDKKNHGDCAEMLVSLEKFAAPYLVGCLSCKKQQEISKKILIEIGEPAVNPAVGALKNKACCEAAKEVLIAIGAPAVNSAVGALGNETQRNAAKEVLIAIGAPAVSSTTGALESETHHQAAKEVLTALFERDETSARVCRALILSLDFQKCADAKKLREIAFRLLAELALINQQKVLDCIANWEDLDGRDRKPILEKLKETVKQNQPQTRQENGFAQRRLLV